MEKLKAFLKRKDIEISLKRYGIDALGAMAQGLFCSLLIGTIIDTVGKQLNIPFLKATVLSLVNKADGSTIPYTVGGLAQLMSGPAMAVAIAYALKCPPLVLFSMITVGFAANALGGAGGPLAVLFIAIILIRIFSNGITNPIKELVGAAYRPEDPSNNSNDDLSNIHNFIRQHMKNEFERSITQ